MPERSQLAENLAAAWTDRARVLATDVRAMFAAPALFKPDTLSDAIAAGVRADREVVYWSTTGALTHHPAGGA